MERSARPSAEQASDDDVQCSAPHPLFGLGVTLVLAAIGAGLVYLLGR